MAHFVVKFGRFATYVTSVPFVIVLEMVKGLFEHDNVLTHPSNAHPGPVVRTESYRTLKRRNRLMRKFDHKDV